MKPIPTTEHIYHKGPEGLFIIYPGKVPAGNYPGTWGGYQVRFFVDKKEFIFFSEVGIRTPDHKVRVRIDEEGKVCDA